MPKTVFHFAFSGSPVHGVYFVVLIMHLPELQLNPDLQPHENAPSASRHVPVEFSICLHGSKLHGVAHSSPKQVPPFLTQRTCFVSVLFADSMLPLSKLTVHAFSISLIFVVEVQKAFAAMPGKSLIAPFALVWSTREASSFLFGSLQSKLPPVEISSQ